MGQKSMGNESEEYKGVRWNRRVLVGIGGREVGGFQERKSGCGVSGESIGSVRGSVRGTYKLKLTHNPD